MGTKACSTGEQCTVKRDGQIQLGQSMQCKGRHRGRMASIE